jgi:hypothetical protein
MGVLLAGILTLALGQDRGTWTVGVEREVDAGIYMQVFASEHGWRVWRIESREDVQCQAIKSARGRPHPAPAGVGAMFVGGTPYLQITENLSLTVPRKRFNYTWHARHYGDVRVQYRLIGERFWTNLSPLSFGPPPEFDPAILSERAIEISVESFEYPAINRGYSKETAIFELSGLDWALNEISRCVASNANQPNS